MPACSLTNSSYFSRDESLREPVATFIVVRCERTMVFFPGRVRERASSQPNPFTWLSTLATLSRRGERAVSRQAQALPSASPRDGEQRRSSGGVEGSEDPTSLRVTTDHENTGSALECGSLLPLLLRPRLLDERFTIAWEPRPRASSRRSKRQQLPHSIPLRDVSPVF